ncbi:MAG: tRNA 2-thiouridine(34) synthase MnmA [Armatimonadetes bacterium]|nr:tRNA 2-thiouridine(34) synthase MnmA [Armatimonadota bacterium]MCX7968635.1 tRNA 2-thiouridine(34) synthase MnmA [Armatimonadota bacterium]MDW8142222.1 tRNA 2-thiouridine(34) synthase MnmA [Armatimonadota bacterium]
MAFHFESMSFPSISKGQRVLVAMSGGVDSSVTAALLKEQGYEVIGVTFHLWGENKDSRNLKSCCGLASVEDACRVANKLGIPHLVVNMIDFFSQTVVADFINEYARGRTPNPCIRCNEFIKYGLFLKGAETLGAGFVATGHYAKIVKGEDGRYRLLKAADKQKDQSYVLYVLTQSIMAKVLLPLGNYKKSEVREIARRLDLPVHDKPESQEICFVGTDDYRDFLKKMNPDLVKPGPIVTEDGKVIGTHMGVAFYTVGQRHGLGISNPSGEPLYVVTIDAETNTIVVGRRELVLTKEAIVEAVNWVSGKEPEKTLRAKVKHRYKSPEGLAWVEPIEGKKVRVIWDEPQWAVTPGQSAVFYDAETGEEVLGGGIICKTVSKVGER